MSDSKSQHGLSFKPHQTIEHILPYGPGYRYPRNPRCILFPFEATLWVHLWAYYYDHTVVALGLSFSRCIRAAIQGTALQSYGDVTAGTLGGRNGFPRVGFRDAQRMESSFVPENLSHEQLATVSEVAGHLPSFESLSQVFVVKDITPGLDKRYWSALFTVNPVHGGFGGLSQVAPLRIPGDGLPLNFFMSLQALADNKRRDEYRLVYPLIKPYFTVGVVDGSYGRALIGQWQKLPAALLKNDWVMEFSDLLSIRPDWCDRTDRAKLVSAFKSGAWRIFDWMMGDFDNAVNLLRTRHYQNFDAVSIIDHVHKAKNKEQGIEMLRVVLKHKGLLSLQEGMKEAAQLGRRDLFWVLSSQSGGADEENMTTAFQGAVTKEQFDVAVSCISTDTNFERERSTQIARKVLLGNEEVAAPAPKALLASLAIWAPDPRTPSSGLGGAAILSLLLDLLTAEEKTLLDLAASVHSDHNLIRPSHTGRPTNTLAFGQDWHLNSEAYDFTLLHLAILARNEEFVDLLLELECARRRRTRTGSQSEELTESPCIALSNIAAKTFGNWTPLHVAVGMGSATLCRQLLEHGADPRLKAVSPVLPNTPLSCIELAVLDGHVVCLRSFLDFCGIHTSKSTSATAKRVTSQSPSSAQRQVLESHFLFSPQTELSHQRSLLRLAADGNDHHCLSVLLSCTLPSADGRTTVGGQEHDEELCWKRNNDIPELLFELIGFSPRMYAGVQSSRTRVLEVLLGYVKQNCPHLLVELCSKTGLTPLHSAVKSGTISTVILLLSAIADTGVACCVSRSPDPKLLRREHRHGKNTQRRCEKGERCTVECRREMWSGGTVLDAQGRTPKDLAGKTAQLLVGRSVGEFAKVW